MLCIPIDIIHSFNRIVLIYVGGTCMEKIIFYKLETNCNWFIEMWPDMSSTRYNKYSLYGYTVVS